MDIRNVCSVHFVGFTTFFQLQTGSSTDSTNRDWAHKNYNSRSNWLYIQPPTTLHFKQIKLNKQLKNCKQPDIFCFLDRAFSIMKTKINQQNAQINSASHSYRIVTRTHIHNNILTDQYNGFVTLKDFELPDDGFDWGAETCWSDWSVIN